MQPYFLPYVGYLQLMRAVDVFVWLDDVQFVKHRWMNRNRILLDGSPRWLTLPVRSSPLSTTIQHKRYELGDRQVARLGETLRHAYGNRPGWSAVEALLLELKGAPTDAVSEVNELLLVRCLALLGVPSPRLVRSSQLGVFADVPQRRVVRLVRALGGDEYVNLPGGRELYSAEDFAAEGVALSFLEPRFLPYEQGSETFTPGLSVIDAMANAAAAAVGTDTVAVVRA